MFCTWDPKILANPNRTTCNNLCSQSGVVRPLFEQFAVIIFVVEHRENHMSSMAAPFAERVSSKPGREFAI